ncbi:MAG: AzlD domain-containing protein [Polaromonas sp.]
MNQTDLWTVGTIVGMALVTLLTRCFFFISDRDWTLPAWATRGLDYAPIAALAAVIMPEVVVTQGQLIASWQDARLFAAMAGAAWYYWRHGVLGTILAGMAVYLPLHLVLGW